LEGESATPCLALPSCKKTVTGIGFPSVVL
jgi:hypothetical protein